MTDHKAEWVRDVVRCLEDVAEQMRATGHGDERFMRLIQRAPAAPAASEGEDGAVIHATCGACRRPSGCPVGKCAILLDNTPARPAAQVAATPKHDEGRELAGSLDKSARERAMAWDAVVALLDELSPHWIDHPGTGIDAALNTIRALATQPAARRVTDEDENGEPVGYARWYCRRFRGQAVDTQRDALCEEVWRAAIESFAQPAEGVSE